MLQSKREFRSFGVFVVWMAFVERDVTIISHATRHQKNPTNILPKPKQQPHHSDWDLVSSPFPKAYLVCQSASVVSYGSTVLEVPRLLVGCVRSLSHGNSQTAYLVQLVHANSSMRKRKADARIFYSINMKREKNILGVLLLLPGTE